MRAAWPTAGYSPKFSSRLLARHLLYWLRVERLRVHHQLYWLPDSGSSIDRHGVTGEGRCHEGR